MLRRTEIYVDAALLAFPFALILLLGVTLLPLNVGSEIAAPVAVVGAVLAIAVARVLHRKTIATPLSRDEMLRMSGVAAGAAVVAVLLGIQNTSIGTKWPAVWIGVAAAIGVAAVALLVDAVRDMLRGRTHRVLDVLRLVVIGFLGVLVGTSGSDGGATSGLGVWVVMAAIYLIGVAVVAFLWDLTVSWWGSRDEVEHGRPAVSP